MAGRTEQTIDIRGTKVNVRRGGSGKQVLFLHGAGGLTGWPPFLDRLAQQFEVIAPDHPGFGRSDNPPWLDDVGDLAFFYLDFIAALGLDAVHVVGQSLGGWIALEVAVRDSHAIKSLTLVGSAGIRIKGQPAADIFIVSPEELAALLFHDEKLVEQSIAQTLALADDAANIAALNRVTTAKLGWQPRLFNPRLRKWLHRITVPCHVVWGAEDKVIPPSYADEFKRLISGASVTMIPRAGHLVHVEQADMFVDKVSTFIAAHS